MRTAETAGATGIVLPRHRAVGITPAVTKAAAGAIEYLPVAFVSGIPGALDRAARAGVWWVGLDADGDTSVFDLPVADQPLVLVLGAEGRGLSRLARAGARSWRRSRCTAHRVAQRERGRRHRLRRDRAPASLTKVVLPSACGEVGHRVTRREGATLREERVEPGSPELLDERGFGVGDTFHPLRGGAGVPQPSDGTAQHDGSFGVAEAGEGDSRNVEGAAEGAHLAELELLVRRVDGGAQASCVVAVVGGDRALHFGCVGNGNAVADLGADPDGFAEDRARRSGSPCGTVCTSARRLVESADGIAAARAICTASSPDTRASSSSPVSRWAVVSIVSAWASS